jgi:hypothetical protein
LQNLGNWKIKYFANPGKLEYLEYLEILGKLEIVEYYIFWEILYFGNPGKLEIGIFCKSWEFGIFGNP